MSTDDADRQLGEAIPPTEPNNSEDAIGTPAAAIATTAVPDEVDLSVDAVAEDMIALRLSSATVEGKVMVEVEPARALVEDLAEAIDEAAPDTATATDGGRLGDEERAQVLAAAEQLANPDGPLLDGGDREEVAQLVESMNAAIGD